MKKNNIILVVLLGIITISGKVIFNEDYILIMKWWGTLLIMGTIFYPLTVMLFRKFHDGGWIFSKIIGISISSLIMWILSYTKFLKYVNLNCYIIIAILATINIIIAKENIKTIRNTKFQNILISEIIFLLAFMFWTYIGGMSPQIDISAEKYMDYGFMNATMNSEYMPTEDIWFSGKNINYYYYGQYVAGFITKIANLQVNEGYNLMNAFIQAMIFVMSYTIGYNITKEFVKNNKQKHSKEILIIVAILTGLALSIGSTLHYPIYRYKYKENYSYVNQTWYIGYENNTSDKALTETPSYAGIIGELHGHFIDTIFSLTTLAILFSYIIEDEEKYKISILQILTLGGLLGIQKMTNYWDFPIYIVVIGCIIITKNLICKGINRKNIIITISQIISFIAIEELITYQFSRDLYISASKVCISDKHTSLYQLAVFWALPVVNVCIFIIYLLKKFFINKEDKQNIFRKLNKCIKCINKSDIYAIIISICALGLVFISEIVYVKDVNGDEYHRLNTVFKLTYQSYIMFEICLSYIMIRLLYELKINVLKIVLILMLIMQILTLPYGIDALIMRYKNEEYKGIGNSELYIKKILPDDYKAIQWIKDNIKNNEIVLEAPSQSFENGSRISVFTAHPTVLGWYGHEFIWRATRDYQVPVEEVERWNDIISLYTEANLERAQEIIRKYNISYIYIGNIEIEQYTNRLNLDLLLKLGEVVFKIEENECEQTPVYIIKVK